MSYLSSFALGVFTAWNVPLLILHMVVAFSRLCSRLWLISLLPYPEDLCAGSHISLAEGFSLAKVSCCMNRRQETPRRSSLWSSTSSNSQPIKDRWATSFPNAHCPQVGWLGGCSATPLPGVLQGPQLHLVKPWFDEPASADSCLSLSHCQFEIPNMLPQ